MKKITTLFIALLFAGSSGYFAQSSNCVDMNGYVDSKNLAGTGFYTLSAGALEKASQAYHYSGPGFIKVINIEGQIPTFVNWSNHVFLKVSVYNVDANNRPTTLITSKNIKWFIWENMKSIPFSGSGIGVDDNFAIVVELMSNSNGNDFQIKFTGAGEGAGEDLPSTAGSSTGGNWVSLLPSSDGDLYLYPTMSNFNTASFEAPMCVNTNQTINFTNNSKFTKDRMFNQITEPGYTGGEVLYSWDFGGLGTSTLENPSFTFTAAGAYGVSLTTTIDGWEGPCTNTYTMDISVGLAASANATMLDCAGDGSGSLTIVATGGDNSTYEYSLNGVDWFANPLFTGLDADTYDVYVMDALGCTKAGTAVVPEPAPVVIPAPIGTTLATCGNSDGGLLAIASGGTGTIQYSLDGITYQASGTFTGLAAGTYIVYAKDANGCLTSRSVVINSTTGPSLTLQSITTVSCNGGNDGSITVIGSNGVGTLEYSIDGISFQPTGTFGSVSAGMYTPSVKDAAGCIGSVGTVVITEPNQIRFTATQVTASCAGSSDGQINVGPVTGGTGTISYSLDGVNFQSGTNFSGLPANTYTVTARDAANCTSSLIITVKEPAPIVVTLDSYSDLSCFESCDGELSVSATGGNGGYTFTLDEVNYQPSGEFFGLDAGNYSVVVTDTKGCKGSLNVPISQPSEIMSALTAGNSTCGNSDGTLLAVASGGAGTGYTYSIDGGTTSNGTGAFSGLIAGSYVVWVTDADGCSELFSTIVVDSDGPSIVSYSSTDVTCNDGSDGTVTITSVTGGTGTLMYSVNGGTFQTSNVLTGLNAGNNTVVVRDAIDCTGSVTVTLSEPSAITVVLTVSNVVCHNTNTGSISVSAGGGQGTLAYSLDGINFQSTPVFNNLAFGTYTVTVRDAGQCEKTAIAQVTQPPAIGLFIGTLNVSCNGEDNGAINAVAIGGTGSFEYSLDGISYQPTGVFSNLPGNMTYNVYARDASGCVKIIATFVAEPAQLALSSVISNVSCAGGDNGVVDISVNGGTPPYSYSWSNQATSEDIFNLEPGVYTVNITDANGCTVSNGFVVTEPLNPLIVNGTVTDASGVSATDGVVDVTVSGGTPPYSYEWSTGATSEDLSGLAPGVYDVIATDAQNCTFSMSFTVEASTGIDEVYNGESLNIYPNPTSEIVNIDLGADVTAENIELIDPMGKIVYTAINKTDKFEIDVRYFAEGLYFINLYIGNNLITKKIIINR